MPQLKPIWKRSMVLVLNAFNTYYFYALFATASTQITPPSSLIMPFVGIGVDSTFLFSILRSGSNER